MAYECHHCGISVIGTRAYAETENSGGNSRRLYFHEQCPRADAKSSNRGRVETRENKARNWFITKTAKEPPEPVVKLLVAYEYFLDDQSTLVGQKVSGSLKQTIARDGR
jgi:hypothetical protein